MPRRTKKEMAEAAAKLAALQNEIIQFSNDNNLSFYELAAYAYNNEKHEWIKQFRTRSFGRFIRLNCRRETYNKPYNEALLEYTIAESQYYKRHTTEQGTWKD